MRWHPNPPVEMSISYPRLPGAITAANQQHQGPVKSLLDIAIDACVHNKQYLGELWCWGVRCGECRVCVGWGRQGPRASGRQLMERLCCAVW